MLSDHDIVVKVLAQVTVAMSDTFAELQDNRRDITAALWVRRAVNASGCWSSAPVTRSRRA